MVTNATDSHSAEILLGVASGVPIFCFRKVYIEMTNPHSKVVFFAAEKKRFFHKYAKFSSAGKKYDNFSWEIIKCG